MTMRWPRLPCWTLSFILLRVVAESDNSMNGESSPWNVCGSSCVLDWAAMADGYQCGSRIQYLINQEGNTATNACYRVAKTEYPDICGNCNPDQQENGNEADILAEGPHYCGCDACDQAVWDTLAGEYDCGARINYLFDQLSDFYPTEQDACRRVASVEFPSQCGACNPDSCREIHSSVPLLELGGGGEGTQTPEPSPFASDQQSQDPLSEESEDLSLTTAAPQQQQQQQYFQQEPQMEHIPPTEVYCFPPLAQRKRYSNVWSKYWVEVKEGESCGPSNNLFTESGVTINENMSELTLTMGRQPDGRWHGSEVRILLPNPTDYYDYGKYSFSVKSIQVVDTQNNSVVSMKLPMSVILGLFTWDDTEDYNLREQESWMHEVDIELSQWNVPNNEDVQFLVQPPGGSNTFRFYSGHDPNVPAFNQAPNIYEFDWKPAEISWKSTAGGGRSFTYGAQAAGDANMPDYTQCMPANVEVRINLWHLFGPSPPDGVEDTHQVEVVIDDFTYAPSGLRGVSVGGVCSKDCQCVLGLLCVDKICQDGPTAASASSEMAAQQSSWSRRHPWAMAATLLSLLALTVGFVLCRKYRSRQVQADYSSVSKKEGAEDVEMNKTVASGESSVEK
jgi:hypothetical protein